MGARSYALYSVSPQISFLPILEITTYLLVLRRRIFRRKKSFGPRVSYPRYDVYDGKCIQFSAVQNVCASVWRLHYSASSGHRRLQRSKRSYHIQPCGTVDRSGHRWGPAPPENFAGRAAPPPATFSRPRAENVPAHPPGDSGCGAEQLNQILEKNHCLS